ncbi:MAG: HAMP domain-containing protein [Sedimentisphaerales bacterium]|nr:HAMP domain-containing protein [Sedimentisphaerales bacterium]
MDVCAEVATPITENAGSLAANIQKSQVVSQEILTCTDEAAIQACLDKIDTLDSSFNAGQETLTDLCRSLDDKLKINIQTAINAQKAFVTQTHAMTDAQKTKLEKSQQASQRLTDFENQCKILNETLFEFTRQAETAMNEKEETAKTMAMSGDATVEVLGEIIEETFNDNYPLVIGAATLTKYLIQLKDVAHIYLNERDAEQLQALEEKFQKLAKSFASNQKRLQSRLQTEESKTTFQNLTDGFNKMQDIVLAKDGLFALYRESQAANDHAVSIQESMLTESTNCITAIDSVVNLAKNLHNEAKSNANTRVHQAQSSLVTIILGGIVVGVLFGILIARSIIKPLKRTVNMLKDIAEGEGDLTQRLDDTRLDEMGEMARWFNIFIEKLLGIIKQIMNNANTLSASSLQLSATATQMATSAEGMHSQSSSVAAAAEQMSAKMTNISSSTEKMSGNINTVASSIEEMTASGLSEISSASQEITKNISGVNSGVKENSEGAAQTQAAGNQLSELSRNLKSLVGHFKLGQMSFQAAPIKEAHSLWKTKLSDFLDGKISLDPAEINDPHVCDFDKWYMDEGTQKYGRLQIFQDIDLSHQKVHKTAQKVAQLVKDGKKQEARELFKQFHDITAKLFDQLDHLEQEINQTETATV